MILYFLFAIHVCHNFELTAVQAVRQLIAGNVVVRRPYHIHSK